MSVEEKVKGSCGGTCEHCPLALTDASEQVQNYGCLPTGHDVLMYKRMTGHNWACHETGADSGILKICRGLVSWSKDENLNLDFKQGGLIDYDDWYHNGEWVSIANAYNRLSEEEKVMFKEYFNSMSNKCQTCTFFDNSGYCRHKRMKVTATTDKCSSYSRAIYFTK